MSMWTGGKRRGKQIKKNKSSTEKKFGHSDAQPSASGCPDVKNYK